MVVQGSPKIEAVTNHDSAAADDISIAIDASEISGTNEHTPVPSIVPLPADSQQQTFPLMLDVSK